MKNRKCEIVVPLFVFSILAIFYAYVTYPSTISGTFSDSVFYLFMAEYFSGYPMDNPPLVSAVVSESVFPPLYPLLLSAFGVGTVDIGLAHWVTTATFITSLGALFLWLRACRVTTVPATILIALLAVTPGMFYHSLFISSEFLFLTALFLAFYLNEKESFGDSRYWLMALLFGMAALTRSVGIIIFPVFAIVLLRKQVPRWPLVLLIGAGPVLLWSLYRSSASSGTSYTGKILWHWSHTPITKLLAEWINQFDLIWQAWLSFFSIHPSLFKMLVLTILLGLALVGLVWRVRKMTLDGLFMLLYFAVLIAWPFPHEMKRFMVVAVPVLLCYAYLAGLRLIERKYQNKQRMFGYLFCLTVAITSYSSYQFIWQRLRTPVEPELVAHTRMTYWYQPIPVDEVVEVAKIWQRIIETTTAVKMYVPENECVYSIDFDNVMLYANRYSIQPPVNRNHSLDPLANFNQCNYFLMLNIEQLQRKWPAMYPISLLKGHLQPIIVNRISELGKDTYIAILAKKIKPEK